MGKGRDGKGERWESISERKEENSGSYQDRFAIYSSVREGI